MSRRAGTACPATPASSLRCFSNTQREAVRLETQRAVGELSGRVEHKTPVGPVRKAGLRRVRPEVVRDQGGLRSVTAMHDQDIAYHRSGGFKRGGVRDNWI